MKEGIGIKGLMALLLVEVGAFLDFFNGGADTKLLGLMLVVVINFQKANWLPTLARLEAGSRWARVSCRPGTPSFNKLHERNV